MCQLFSQYTRIGTCRLLVNICVISVFNPMTILNKFADSSVVSNIKLWAVLYGT